VAAHSVSVVICTRDRPAAAERCLTAIADGETKPLEVVLVDQGLMSHEVARAALERAGVRFVHLRIEPGGTSRGRNAGIEVAEGTLIAFTDDDCMPDSSWLKHLVRAVESTGAASGRVLPLPSTDTSLVAVSSRTSTRRARFDPDADAFPWEVGTGGNLLVRREFLAAIRGFNDALGPGTRYPAAEDIDLIDRLLAAGCSFTYEPDAVVLHEMKSRRSRLASRYPYGRGMGAFIAAERRRQSRERPSLLHAYLRLQVTSFRRGLAGLKGWQTIETACVLAGFVAGFSSFWFAAGRRGRRPV
jgi:GT2 family glycosyltransferase